MLILGLTVKRYYNYNFLSIKYRLSETRFLFAFLNTSYKVKFFFIMWSIMETGRIYIFYIKINLDNWIQNSECF